MSNYESGDFSPTLIADQLGLCGRVRSNAFFVPLSLINNKSILDIGYGSCWFEQYIAKFFPSRVVGLDANPKLPKEPPSGMLFIRGSALSLPFGNAEFDTIVMREVLEHLPKHSEILAFKEIVRVMKKDARCFISTPFASAVSMVTDPAWWLIGHRHYKLHDIEEFSATSGLVVVQSFIIGGFWNILNLWNLYISKWFFAGKLSLESRLSKKEDIEYGHKNGFMTLFVELKRNES